MKRAAAAVTDEQLRPIIAATLDACGTADAWLAALEVYPGALGLTERAEIGDLDLEVACWENEETPVCLDAAEQGRL